MIEKEEEINHREEEVERMQKEINYLYTIVLKIKADGEVKAKGLEIQMKMKDALAQRL